MTSAPASTAALATSGRWVSTEITASVTALTLAMTGATRSISSATSMWAWAAEKAKPPMSTQSAPSETARVAASTARSSSNVRPWSWKELGVLLTMAMMATWRSKSNSRRPMRRTGAMIPGKALRRSRSDPFPSS